MVFKRSQEDVAGDVSARIPVPEHPPAESAVRVGYFHDDMPAVPDFNRFIKGKAGEPGGLLFLPGTKRAGKKQAYQGDKQRFSHQFSSPIFLSNLFPALFTP